MVASSPWRPAPIRGFQAAFMAPTEVLGGAAGGKHEELMAGTGLRVAYLTSSVTGKARREAFGGSRAGAPLAVGTHSLFQEKVEYARLGLVVIDEQHRFGVEQRARLVAKGTNPNVLVMTATPIPRSLAMTLYGDLDLSVLDELPPGTTAVVTAVRDEAARHSVEAFLRKEMDAGGRSSSYLPSGGGVGNARRPGGHRGLSSAFKRVPSAAICGAAPRKMGAARRRRPWSAKCAPGRSDSWWPRPSSKWAWTCPRRASWSWSTRSGSGWRSSTSSGAAWARGGQTRLLRPHALHDAGPEGARSASRSSNDEGRLRGGGGGPVPEGRGDPAGTRQWGGTGSGSRTRCAILICWRRARGMGAAPGGSGFPWGPGEEGAFRSMGFLAFGPLGILRQDRLRLPLALVAGGLSGLCPSRPMASDGGDPGAGARPVGHARVNARRARRRGDGPAASCGSSSRSGGSYPPWCATGASAEPVAFLLVRACAPSSASTSAGFLWTMAWLVKRRGPWALALAPCAWVLWEWLRGHLLSGMPWWGPGYR